MTNSAKTTPSWLLLTGLIGLAVALIWYFSFRNPTANPAPPNSVHLSGTVSFQGRPIPLGLIVFEPDSSLGGSGAQGFASIQNGTFDTSKSDGQAVAIGPCMIRVTGGDGEGIDAFTPFGNMMFEEYQLKMAIEPENGPLKIEVPASQAFRKPSP